jgi:hypothetical protein
MPWFRAALVWMLFILAETGSGMVREVFIAPVIGALRARQLGVLVGCIIIFIIAWLTARWMGAGTRRQQLSVGAFWVLLTLIFEFALGGRPARAGHVFSRTTTPRTAASCCWGSRSCSSPRGSRGGFDDHAHRRLSLRTSSLRSGRAAELSIDECNCSMCSRTAICISS